MKYHVGLGLPRVEKAALSCCACSRVFCSKSLVAACVECSRVHTGVIWGWGPLTLEVDLDQVERMEGPT